MDPTSAPSLIKRKDADLIERQRVFIAFYQKKDRELGWKGFLFGRFSLSFSRE